MEGACCSCGKCSGHINSETMQRLLLENFTKFLEALLVQQADGELKKQPITKVSKEITQYLSKLPGFKHPSLGDSLKELYVPLCSCLGSLLCIWAMPRANFLAISNGIFLKMFFQSSENSSCPSR